MNTKRDSRIALREVDARLAARIIRRYMAYEWCALDAELLPGQTEPQDPGRAELVKMLRDRITQARKVLDRLNAAPEAKP